jgi:hypothetical protein
MEESVGPPESRRSPGEFAMAQLSASLAVELSSVNENIASSPTPHLRLKDYMSGKILIDR